MVTSTPVHPCAADVSLAGGSAGEATWLKFWGVRGSIPTPGEDTVYYGGNTSCVEVRVGSDIIILDAGSGLRCLGQSLAAEFKGRPMRLNLLLTHTHWDHIQGFPFFIPAYDAKNALTVYGYEGASRELQLILSSQMESPYFPISMGQMPGHIAVCELRDMEFNVNNIPVRARLLNHPGICAGYRLETPAGAICYLPDVELAHPSEEAGVIEFLRGAEVVILDAQYDVEEYVEHMGWGHSCLLDTVGCAAAAGVRQLFLFHHDPDHNDEKVSSMAGRARQTAKQSGSNLIVEAAREGHKFVLDPQIVSAAAGVS